MENEEHYAPTPRDRDAERRRCERTILGYSEERSHSSWVRRLRAELALGEALEEFLPERRVELPPSL